jgi:uncharacterized membrane protein
MDEQNSLVQPSTAEVLAEVRKRRAQAPPPMSEGQRRIVVTADRFVFWLSKHWLAVLNVLAFLYVGLPILAPVLMHLGAERPAMAIHLIYRPLCNQLPQRSWFLFGPQSTYTPAEFLELAGVDVVSNPVWAGTYVGNEVIGYKIGLCQRCVAIHGAIFLFGLLYALGRRRVRPLPLWAYVVFGLLPMAVDGGYQLMSTALPILLPDLPIRPYESTSLMRVITGTLFGLATVWLAYPYVQETMDEFRETLQQRFGWK